MKVQLKNCLILSALFLSLTNISLAQSTIIGQEDGGRMPLTSSSFLLVSPDARSAAMGDAGGGLSADANAAYWNPAKLARLTEKTNVSFTYSPWLRSVLSDMNLYHFAAAQRLGEKGALGLSATYLDLGDIQLTTTTGNIAPISNPNDLSVTLSYAYQLSEYWSIGGSGKYISNNYNGSISASGIPQSASSFALDLGGFYEKDISFLKNESVLAVSASVANLGPKMNYFVEERFLPANLNLGASISSQFSEDHALTWAVNLRKLMVPTPDTIYMSWADKGWFSGTFGSFGDAPGGFSEEMHEIMIGTGLEYTYRGMLSLRGGYYHEAKDKGNRQYFTTGLGIRYQLISLDLAYLLPVGSSPGYTNPLQETLRIGMQIRFGEIG